MDQVNGERKEQVRRERCVHCGPGILHIIFPPHINPRIRRTTPFYR